MTQEDIKKYQQATKDGSIQDEENPIHLFNLTRGPLLAKVVSGEIDAVTLARYELRNRGLNDKGKWVGFSATE